ncbi:MAG TPA: L,D-transpeptidase family protein [Bacteroidales bacterium]
MADNTSFKQKQLSFERVKTAYNEKEKEVTLALINAGIRKNELEICIVAFKQEKVLELWARSKHSKEYKLIKEYSICTSSGTLGPKRKEGDMQVPEGFYHISHFNPESNFYLSLGINYPNESDKILADKKHPGGAIYIHGNCVTIGCIPITDEWIKELYVYAVEARNNGENQIPVSIFPCRLTDSNFTELKKNYAANKSLLEFWKNLKQGYEFFHSHKYLPKINVIKSGAYSYQ